MKTKEEQVKWTVLRQGGNTYNRYLISSEGVVWDTKSDREVSQVLTGKPQYYYVNLTIDEDGNRILRRVHNIMGWSFLGDPPTPKHSVDHIDQDKFNNRLSNLRWLDRRGQMNNRGNTQYYEGVPVTTFLESRGYDLKSSKGNFIYRKLTLDLISYEDAIWAWSEFVYPSPKRIPENKFIEGYQDKLFWYPSKGTYIESIANCTYNTYKKRIKRGIPHQEALSYVHEWDTGNYTLNGKAVGLDKYCKYHNVSSIRIADIMRKQNLSVEEAIKVPVQRIIKHAINDKVKRNSDWAKYYSIPPVKFKTQSNKRGFKKALEYFGVDTSDMEIYPCDGDVIMYHDKRYISS